jgi:hypothetical protein
MAVLLFVLSAQAAIAQTSIFNVPTTDTVEKGKTYFEIDFLPQLPAATRLPRIYPYIPRLVVGVADKVEVGANFPIIQNSTTCSPTPTTCSYAQINAKWRFYNKDSTGIALAAGGLWHTPINKHDVQDSWALLYALFSKKIKTGNYGPRFHGGPFFVGDANQDIAEGPIAFSGSRTGVILGYEQPIHSKINVVADWFSGKNFYGYFTPGVSFIIHGNGYFNVGYAIGNDTWENHNAARNRFLYVYYAVTF